MIYSCSNCDSQFPKWQGQCPECNQWGTIAGTSDKQAQQKKADSKVQAVATQKLNKISDKKIDRLNTNIDEFDHVLGGGIVPGSLVLLGGDPGIGKSTLILQAAQAVQGKVLYVSAEESAAQVRLRSDRLKVKAEHIDFLAEENVEIIIKTAIKQKPVLLIIDSIQTVFSDQAQSEPGTITQVKAACIKFLELAKKNNLPVILVGHVTKDGQLAGPKSLEHLVDTVLYLEGDQYQHYRLLRTQKNRFGATNEVGVFEMQETGLIQVKDPSQLFLANISQKPGSCVTTVLEGKRIFLIEVQALVTKTVFGYPVRKSSGFDNNRLQMLLAVLTKRAKLPLGTQDVHINIVGGLKIKEPACDLAVCLAIISAFTDKPLPKNTVTIGEVGLGGEVRSVTRFKDRVKEAKKLNFTNIISVDQVKDISEAATKAIK